MTQQEFQTRVQLEVTADEFYHINEVYMNSDLDKDEFCKLWVKMNQARVNKAKAEAKAAEAEAKVRERLYNIINRNYEGAYNQFAEDHFNETQQNLLAEVGIQMYNERVEPYFGHTVRDPKLVSTILYEIKKYLKVA